MFKGASQKAQAKARRVTPKRLGDFAIEPNELERKENLGAISSKLALRLRDEALTGEQRKLIAAEYAYINGELQKLNVLIKYKFGPKFNDSLCDVIKSEVTKPQWEIWIEKAKTVHDKLEKENKEILEKVATYDLKNLEGA